MRRGEKAPPVYRASRVGMERTIPFKRPNGDSIPKHECETPWCGKGVVLGDLKDSAWMLGQNIGSKRLRQFCSLGCLSRWAIVQELRS